MDHLDEALRGLSDPIRRRILSILRDDELAAGAIADQFDVTRPAVSHHLRVLREAGLVTERREGQNRYYSANRDGIEVLKEWFHSFFPLEEYER
ncbi:MAG: metalloregulator ArsR/SmtB family transcription factor [Acidimicrobiia bacterium]|nr:metalloregulator ArsR/SmtB family transcription factor [Acidimicrobiia bacterium]MBT8214434.1 metalloregulator ArsR/SmtB family transcription factor [Acidimicrobiia bacterium]NNF69774.1 winged helix-turn-helix transcriptional regulator [Acidimicrobiia bacterium]NNK90869.1 winged helix-turn-helix transcriptional regulator [Acidimicrobiia bacterium]